MENQFFALPCMSLYTRESKPIAMKAFSSKLFNFNPAFGSQGFSGNISTNSTSKNYSNRDVPRVFTVYYSLLTKTNAIKKTVMPDLTFPAGHQPPGNSLVHPRNWLGTG